MKLCLTVDYASDFARAAREIGEMERAGLDMLWVSEAYGADAVSRLGYLAAVTESVRLGAGILPLYSRTPAMLAMSAYGINELSGGRFELGIGASGPNVVEGWHGVAYENPIARTRDVVAICRKAWQRDQPLTHDGDTWQLPLPKGVGTGLGRPLKLIGKRPDPLIPIWVAALGTRNVALAAELADGWLPTLVMPEHFADVWSDALRVGTARRDEALSPLQIACGGIVAIGTGADVRAVRERVRPTVALYVGGMGPPGRNFYNSLIARYGYSEAAAKIQALYLDGRVAEAEAAVPDALLDAAAICGPPAYVADRVAAYAAVGVTHLNVTPIPVGDQRRVDVIAALRSIVDAM